MVTAVHGTRWCMAPWEKRPIQQSCNMVAPLDLDRCSFGTSRIEKVEVSCNMVAVGLSHESNKIFKVTCSLNATCSSQGD